MAESSQGDILDGSLWPDGCPQCTDGRPRYPYMWADGTARYLCPDCRHPWTTAWDDLPKTARGTNILNAARRTA